MSALCDQRLRWLANYIRNPVNASHHTGPVSRPGCQNTLFGLLEPSSKLGSPRAIEVMDYSSGEAIQRHGQPGQHLHAVCKGLVRLEQRLPDDTVRVARLLLHMSQSTKHDGVCQAPPRDNMASLLGLTAETVNRTTAAFKREGMITEEFGVVTCDAQRLTQVSQDAETAPARLLET